MEMKLLKKGMELFTLKDIQDIKQLINKTKMTMTGFRYVMGKVKQDYNVSEQTAFNATQYCLINRKG